MALGHQCARVFDVGNIDGPNRSLEDFKESLTNCQTNVELEIQPIVLGGGHETAYGHYLGLKSSLQPDEQLAVINLDAHFDLRPYDQTGPNSGTGFRQMADHAKKGKDFPYLIILGFQSTYNNLFLFNYVAKTPSIDF